MSSPAAFTISANGPDLASARVLPPASSLENSLSSSLEFSRRGLPANIQERLHGINRRLSLDSLRELLSCPSKDEKMMLAASAQELAPAGPPVSSNPFASSIQRAASNVSTTKRPSARRGMEFKPKIN